MTVFHSRPWTSNFGLWTIYTFYVFWALLVASELSGCTPSLRQPSPSTASPALELPTAEQLLAPLTARQQRITSLRGLARVSYKDQQEKGTARQAVAVTAPDHFRLELFSLLGVAALVATDGHTLAAYMPREKTIYRGSASPSNAARLLRVMLSAAEITNLLLGLPLFLPQDDNGTVRLDANAGWYVLTIPVPGGGIQMFAFDQKTLRLFRWEIQNADGVTLARMTLAGYRIIQGQEFPFEIVLSDLQGNQEAAIYYEQVEVSPPLPDTLFTLAPITGVQEKNLDVVDSP